VLLWAGTILVTVPLVRSLQEWVAVHLGSAFFGYLTITGLAVALSGAVVLLGPSAVKWPRSLAWLGGVTAVAMWWTLHLWARPEEAVHVLEYGLLSLLVVRAMRCRLRDPWVFLCAVLLTAGFGVIDELVQWVTPRRYFDLRDVWLNTGAAGLAQIGLWQGVLEARQRTGQARPGLAGGRLIEPASRRGARLACRLGAALVLLLLVVLAATPARLEQLAGQVPWFERLLDPSDVIVEYGHFHRVEGIGRFRSRLDLAELERQDHDGVLSAGATIRTFRGDYGAFLRLFPSGSHPFLHEVRVHLFSRDRNLDEATHLEPGSPGWWERMLQAEGEQRILERFFPRTVAASGHALDPRTRQRLAAAWSGSASAGSAVQDSPIPSSPAPSSPGPSREYPSGEFQSKVSSHLITVLSEGALRGVLIALLVLLVGVDLVLGRRRSGRALQRADRHGRGSSGMEGPP